MPFTHFEAFTSDFWGRNVISFQTQYYCYLFCFVVFVLSSAFCTYFGLRCIGDTAENFMRCLHRVCSSRSPFPLLFELLLKDDKVRTVQVVGLSSAEVSTLQIPTFRYLQNVQSSLFYTGI